jgi:hypothetical protein
LFSVANGYVAAVLYKFFNGTDWLALTILTSSGMSGFLVGSLTLIDLMEFF